MKKLTIRRRIMASFAIVLVLLAIMASIAYRQLTNIGQFASDLEKGLLPGLNYSSCYKSIRQTMAS